MSNGFNAPRIVGQGTIQQGHAVTPLGDRLEESRRREEDWAESQRRYEKTLAEQTRQFDNTFYQKAIQLAQQDKYVQFKKRAQAYEEFKANDYTAEYENTNFDESKPESPNNPRMITYAGDFETYYNQRYPQESTSYNKQEFERQYSNYLAAKGNPAVVKTVHPVTQAIETTASGLRSAYDKTLGYKGLRLTGPNSRIGNLFEQDGGYIGRQSGGFSGGYSTGVQPSAGQVIKPPSAGMNFFDKLTEENEEPVEDKTNESGNQGIIPSIANEPNTSSESSTELDILMEILPMIIAGGQEGGEVWGWGQLQNWLKNDSAPDPYIKGKYVPGNRTGDKNPAMLEDGEYVLNRNAVDAIGKENLDEMNYKKYPRFQSGGFIAALQQGGSILDNLPEGGSMLDKKKWRSQSDRDWEQRELYNKWIGDAVDRLEGERQNELEVGESWKDIHQEMDDDFQWGKLFSWDHGLKNILNAPTRGIMDFGRGLFGYETLDDIERRQKKAAAERTQMNPAHVQGLQITPEIMSQFYQLYGITPQSTTGSQAIDALNKAE